MKSSIGALSFALIPLAVHAAAPTDIFLSNAVIDEGIPIDSVVGTLSAEDEDRSDTFTFTLVAGKDDDDNGDFLISGDILRTGERVDFETQSTYSIRVQVEDAERNTFQKALTISVRNDRTEDTDNDGLTEQEEEDIHMTSDLDRDGDDDGFGDGDEVGFGSDPLDAQDSPFFRESVRMRSPNNVVAEQEELGASVAISGDFAIVGAPLFDIGGADKGAVYFYVRENGVWSEQTVRFGEAAGDKFGHSVSLDGDLAVIGAPENDGKGAAYLYKFNGTDNWLLEEKWVPVAAQAGDEVGYAVALEGEIALIGAPETNGSGRVYLYLETSPGNWAANGSLPAFPSSGDRFGAAIAVSGDVAWVGSPDADDNGSNSGNVRRFAGPVSWSGTGTITPMDGEAFDRFGTAIWLDGGRAVVGAPAKKNGAGEFVGAAHVFGLVGGTWIEQQTLMPADLEEFDRFGQSVAGNGETLVIGADGRDGDGATSGGAVHVFRRPQVSWVQTQELTSPGTSGFGRALSMDGDSLLVGSPDTEDRFARDGMGHVFILDYYDPEEGPADWQVANGFDPDNPDAAFLDSDGDGVRDVIELLHGTDPGDAADVFRGEVSYVSPTRITMTYLRDRGTSGPSPFLPRPQWSIDLSNWYFSQQQNSEGLVVSLSEAVSPHDAESERVTVTAEAVGGFPDGVFLRVLGTPRVPDAE